MLCLLPVIWAEPVWHQVNFDYPVSAVAMASDSQAWAAGTVSNYLTGFLKWDGVGWVLSDTFRNKLIYDICFADQQAWAVGEQFNFPDGVVLHWNGQGWQQYSDPFNRSLQAVSFADSTTGWAAGTSPIAHHPVMKYTNGIWQIDSALTTQRIILGLAATYIEKVYAVGDSGAIFRFDYGVWTQVPSPTTQTLRRVAMESNTEGWAVGNGGAILRCFKDTWSLAASPTTRNLRGLAIAGTSCEAWAVGDSGTILHCVNDSWQLEPFMPNPINVTMYTVSFVSGAHGWAFGYQTYGTQVALHYYDELEINESVLPGPDQRPGTSIIRGILNLPEGKKYELFDINGRKIADLNSGYNNIRNFAPGIYFLRKNNHNQVTKLVVTK
jgi:photosystem II stability/assembly factor-like uncharacterized protein